MDTTSWVHRVATAPSREAVVSLVKEYVATRDKTTLAILPPEVAAASTVEEIHDCAYRLALHPGHDDLARIVQRVSTFFAGASIRLAELNDQGSNKP